MPTSLAENSCSGVATVGEGVATGAKAGAGVGVATTVDVEVVVLVDVEVVGLVDVVTGSPTSISTCAIITVQTEQVSQTNSVSEVTLSKCDAAGRHQVYST